MKNLLKRLLFSIILLSSSLAKSQDINFSVNVLSNQVALSDKSIFTSLQNSIIQFLNTRKWSKDRFLPHERINCNMVIDISAYDVASNRITATFQIQSLRPTFKSNYSTMLTNFRDVNVSFEYQALQAMDFQENNNVYNLTGILAFYAYIVMGIDYDSYGELAGTPYYQQAKAILDASQNIVGWKANDGQNNQNKFYLIDNLLNERFRPLRETLYRYHRKGLDMMHKNTEQGRKEIEESLKNIQELCRQLPNAMMVRNFFLVKNKEIIEIYKEAPVAEKNRIIDLLKKIDSGNSAEYDKIRQS